MYRTTIEILCTKVTSGGTPSRKKPEFYTGDIPWIKTGELKGWYINDSSEKITEEAIKSSSAKIYPENTVLMAMYGDGGTIGSTAITGIEAASNQACCAMIPDPEKCNPLYLMFLLQLHREAIVALALGGAQRNLNQGTIKSYEVDVHELEEQNHIVDVLANYNNLIENNNRRIAILEDMAQSLYREWFVKFRFPGHENCQFKDSPLGQIPEGWGVRKLKDFGEVITGKTPSKKKEEYYESRDVPFIKTPDMHDGVYVIDTVEMLSFAGADSQKKKLLPAGSISVSCIGTAGVVAINAEPAQTNQQINSIVLAKDSDREFLYFALLDLKQTIINHGSTGATMTNLSKGKFEDLDVIYPKNNFVSQFNSSVQSMFDEILILLRKNKNLKQQRDMLLPKLISGNISLG